MDEKIEIVESVTLRDLFAMAALAGIASDTTSNRPVALDAQMAWKYADAMIAERRKIC